MGEGEGGGRVEQVKERRRDLKNLQRIVYKYMEGVGGGGLF